MPVLPRHRRPRPGARLVLLAALAWAGLIGPAAGQYAGGITLIVDPVLVPIDGEFDAFGFSCPGGTTVTISIDGFPGPLGSTVAADDSSYAVDDIPMPDGVVVGLSYVVRADCDGIPATFTITAVCNDLTLPASGVCPDGRIVGGEDPGTATTTTTTAPGTTPTTSSPGATPAGGPGGGPTPDPGGGSGRPGDGDLAVTGASTAEQALRIGVSLVAVGGLLVLLGRRRDEAAAPA